MTLTDKTILITGAARRLGKALAIACAKQGADIVLHYNSSQSEAEEVRDQVHLLGRDCLIQGGSS